MIRKILCRIVSNCYASFSGKVCKDKEVANLRNNCITENENLDTLMEIHEKIISKEGIKIDELLDDIYRISKYDVKKDVSLYIDLFRVSSSNKYNELIKVIYYSKIPNKLKLLYLETIFNNIYFKEYKEMLLFRPYYLETIKRVIKSNKNFVTDLKKLTDYYITKRKIISLEEIEKIGIEINKTLKQFIKFGNIYYFGSYAKGTQDIYSDLDLFIEVEETNVLPSMIDAMIMNHIKNVFDVDLDVSIHFIGKDYNEFEQEILSYAKKININ